MWIARTIGVTVMPPVRRHPAHERSLQGERTQDGQRDLEWSPGNEAAVGEEAVVSRGHPEHRHDVADDEQGKVEPRHAFPDESADREDGPDEGHHHHHRGHHELERTAERTKVTRTVVSPRRIESQLELVYRHCAPFRDG